MLYHANYTIHQSFNKIISHIRISFLIYYYILFILILFVFCDLIYTQSEKIIQESACYFL